MKKVGAKFLKLEPNVLFGTVVKWTSTKLTDITKTNKINACLLMLHIYIVITKTYTLVIGDTYYRCYILHVYNYGILIINKYLLSLIAY